MITYKNKKIERKEIQDAETPQSEIGQLENKGSLRRSVDRIKLVVALIISLLSGSLKSDFPNKNLLITKTFRLI